MPPGLHCTVAACWCSLCLLVGSGRAACRPQVLPFVLLSVFHMDPSVYFSLLQRYWRWNAYGLVALGIVQAVAGVTTVILNGSKPDSNSSGGSPLLSYLF